MRMNKNMNIKSKPFVSIVTPVFNGEKYLGECIESALNQTYDNWEYNIINNCSKDGSLEIARNYAKQDSRIRIHDNEKFLGMVDNFNHSLLQISDESKYCKILHADDFLFPECIEKMVGLAEENRSVGIVGSYVLEGVRVKYDGLPYPSHVTRGHEICRMVLMDRSPVSGGLYVFGSPTSLLIRSDLIRGRKPFYSDRYLQVVDQEACYHLLQNADFGFVHQVLTFSRQHDNSTTSSGSSLNKLILEELMLLLDYGPVYLSNEEYEKRLSQRIDKYYRFLADSVFENKGKEFWKFHKNGLRRLNLPLRGSRLIKDGLRASARRLAFFLICPKRSL